MTPAEKIQRAEKLQELIEQAKKLKAEIRGLSPGLNRGYIQDCRYQKASDQFDGVIGYLVQEIEHLVVGAFWNGKRP